MMNFYNTAAKAVVLPDFLNVDLETWVDAESMTEQEKYENSDYENLGGYLKTSTYQDAVKTAYIDADSSDKELLFELPEFNIKSFEKITGINIQLELINSIKLNATIQRNASNEQY